MQPLIIPSLPETEYTGDLSGGPSSVYQDDIRMRYMDPLPRLGNAAPYGSVTGLPTPWEMISNKYVLRDYWLRCIQIREEVEQLMDLDELLHLELWMILTYACTANQLQIATMVYQGKTQVQIADILGVNQSSIVKCMIGNIDYNFTPPRRMGGLNKRLTKCIRHCTNIQLIMRQMYMIDPGATQPHYRTFKRTFDNQHQFRQWLFSEIEEPLVYGVKDAEQQETVDGAD